MLYMIECVYLPHLQIQLNEYSFHSQRSLSFLIVDVLRLLRGLLLVRGRKTSLYGIQALEYEIEHCNFVVKCLILVTQRSCPENFRSF